MPPPAVNAPNFDGWPGCQIQPATEIGIILSVRDYGVGGGTTNESSNALRFDRLIKKMPL